MSLDSQRALAGDLPELSAFSALAVSALANSGDADAIGLASEMLASGDAKLQRSAATGLALNRAGRPGLLPGEATVLARIAAHDNDDVRIIGGRAIFSIALADTATAVDLLGKIEFRGSPRVAASALSGFVLQGPLRWSDIPSAERTAVLDQLLDLGSIDEYELMGALSELPQLDPLRVTRLLMQRVDRQSELQSDDYDALPYAWNPALRIHQTTELARCLAEVRDWMTREGHSLRRHRLRDDGAHCMSSRRRLE